MLKESSENSVQSPKPNTSLASKHPDYSRAKRQFAESSLGQGLINHLNVKINGLDALNDADAD